MATLKNFEGLGNFRIAGFGGATSADANTGSLYDVKNGGRLSITDTWYEGPGMGWLNISNSKGAFSFSGKRPLTYRKFKAHAFLQGGNISPYKDLGSTVTISNFEGDILLNSASVVWNATVDNSGGVLFATMSFLASWIHSQNDSGVDVILSM